LLTVLLGLALFSLLGKPPLELLSMFLIAPLASAERLSELCVKATPLLFMGLGLSFCFRANVWNIGAEGQYVCGAIAGGAVALLADADSSPWFVVAVLLAGAVAGMAWAMPCALLRVRFHASEILVSLMLVYVADLALSYLVSGPLRDPQGFNFPQTITFVDASRLSPLWSRYRVHLGTPLALCACALGSMVLSRTHAGFKLALSGLAPAAARYAGVSEARTIWAVMAVSGACAGLAGAAEVAGPLGQLTPYVSCGYGFSAIIVALVARLSPLGVVPAALLLSMFALGGELAQSRLGLPKSIADVFQGLLLLALLACDALGERDLRADARAWLQQIRRGAVW
jgi:simple sugar transport system permease protein